MVVDTPTVWPARKDAATAIPSVHCKKDGKDERTGHPSNKDSARGTFCSWNLGQ